MPPSELQALTPEDPARLAAVERLCADLADLEPITERQIVRRRSRDFFWYSPVLNRQLTGKSADCILMARSEADVIRIAAACVRHRVPLTLRGAGTGNYGQAVPLQGGMLLDITPMNRVFGSEGGILDVEPGARMVDIDDSLAGAGWELRMFPSTKRTATIGGFVAGGSGGIGSVTWGGLREPGNILAARVVTLEEEPRIIALKGDTAQKVNRAYGTTGIITRLEMPLARRYPHMDVIVAVDGFMEAVALGHRVALADGIAKKLLTPIAWPMPSYFGPLKSFCPDGKALLIAMVAQGSLAPFMDMVREAGGEVTHSAPSDESPSHVPLYEYTWNHTTLQVLKSDRTVTYLQCLYAHDRLMEQVREMTERFGDEIIQHLEFIRFGGRVTASALPVVRYTTDERLAEIIAVHEAAGVMIANPHVMTLEDGSRHKRADADQLGFKREVDPYGLLNPGKMRSYVPVGREQEVT